MANPSDPANLQSEWTREADANMAGEGAHQPSLFELAPARDAGQICRIKLATALSRRAF